MKNSHKVIVYKGIKMEQTKIGTGIKATWCICGKVAMTGKQICFNCYVKEATQ